MKLRSLTLDELTIDDERSFRHVALYGDLKQVLLRDGYRFRVIEPAEAGPRPASAKRAADVRPSPSEVVSWDRVLFLNLTFWSPDEQGDLLVSDHIAADVVTHVAWHHLAQRALAAAGRAEPTVEGLLLGESIASAFDLYLVGRLLGNAPDSEFLETQVPAMSDAAEAAGLPTERFEALLDEMTAEPERAFEDLRALLFDAATALVPCRSMARAAEILAGFDGRRFAPLLHHFELSNWILSARANAAHGAPDPAALAVDTALRGADVSLDWLETHWVRPPAPLVPHL